MQQNNKMLEILNRVVDQMNVVAENQKKIMEASVAVANYVIPKPTYYNEVDVTKDATDYEEK